MGALSKCTHHSMGVSLVFGEVFDDMVSYRKGQQGRENLCAALFQFFWPRVDQLDQAVEVQDNPQGVRPRDADVRLHDRSREFRYPVVITENTVKTKFGLRKASANSFKNFPKKAYLLLLRAFRTSFTVSKSSRVWLAHWARRSLCSCVRKSSIL